MKLVEQFNEFLENTVNLNPTRLGLLTESVGALKYFIRDADWTPKLRGYAEQGSWAHKTIIRPVDGKAFDADLLVLVEPVDGWSAKDYLSTLRAVFAEHGIYEDKVRRFSHCVTIEYAGERKVDLAPCVVDRGGVPGHEVCNFDSNQFERSEPTAYTAWLLERNRWTGANGLRKVTRLVKYLRDIKGTFSCPSVLLTTLLGNQISVADEARETEFQDAPSALRTIFARLDDWLQSNATKPVIRNPVLLSEIFSGLLDDEKYGNLREKIHTYRLWIDDAFLESDRDESIGKWRRVFGDDFAGGVVVDKAGRVTEEARQLVVKRAGVLLDAKDDLVALFARFGRTVLPEGFDWLPHKQRPKWRVSPLGQYKVVVVASRHETRGAPAVANVASGEGPLRKGQWLKFTARTPEGSNFGNDYEVHWRITNTDSEAARARCLRGGFESSNDGNSRWEALEYRGVHTVEAFIVRKRDKSLVGQSAPYYVVIN